MVCLFFQGGYFIIKGVEKIILIHEQLSKNRIIIERDDKGGIFASVTSSTHERKSKTYVHLKNGRIYLKNNVLGDDVPIGIVLKAMGVESDMEMVQLIGNEYNLINALALSLEEPVRMKVKTQDQALKWIGTKIRGKSLSSGIYKKNISPEDEAREVLATVVFSHIQTQNFNFREKSIYICHIIRRVILVYLGVIAVDDKDYYGNKRLELAGNLLSLLFEDLFKNFNKDLKRQADLILSKTNRAQEFDVVKLLRPDTITTGLINSIATGNWVLKRFRMDRQGVTQVLSRLSYMSALGMCTKINSQFEKTRKVSGPRSLQPSQWGMLCPADTPEGEACGLAKNLALLSHITAEEPDIVPIHRLCLDLGVEDIKRLSGFEIHSETSFLIFINGDIVGIHKEPFRFAQNLRNIRRQGLTSEFMSIYVNDIQRTVHIATDGGRVCRPLLVIDQDTGCPKLKQAHIEGVVLGTMSVKDLLKMGIIEYLDCNEENDTLIAVSERDIEAALRHKKDGTAHYTHLEIDPFSILGVVGGVIPFPHHNQSPRNTYTVAMAKQAIGCIAMNEYERMDGLIYSLTYPQKPLVKSRTLDLLKFDSIPGGQNAVIAVMSYSGYDIEDSIVLNKASIDRGFGRCMVVRKYQSSVRKYRNGSADRVCQRPSPENFSQGEKDKRFAKYLAIDEDGICCEGERLYSGSIMVNKESPMDTNSSFMGNEFGFGGPEAQNTQRYKPSPMSYRGNTPMIVDRVALTSNESEHFLIKIMLRQVRRPEVGDKFASRHGQKGVCGFIVPEQDLPFNEAGHVPDLIMNPHGFPSRMTVGKLLELLVGKAGVYDGRQGYSTAFGEEFGSADTAEAAAESLIRSGLSYTGKDILYSGTSGEPLDAYIFSGPVFYQKLKHMVLDKAHARARGPRAVLTRQPTEGRSRDGGLRVGEMERDCLIAYGASNLIMERLMHSSDAFSASVCLSCGLLQCQQWCQYCRSGENVTDIRLPYACKLLFQELQSMNVLPRMSFKDQD